MPSVLLVTCAFGPSRRVGARRPERMARHLTARGWKVTVLTLRPEYVPPLDPALRIVGEFEQIATHALMPRRLAGWTSGLLRSRPPAVPVVQPAAVARPARGGLLAAVAPALLGVVHATEIPDEWIGWWPFARLAMRGRRFDVVLGTVPPFSTAVIARDLARQMQARLVLDYRDPWTEVVAATGTRSESRVALYRKIENACLADADLVLGVSPSICDNIRKHARCPVDLLTNGYVPRTGAAPRLAAGGPPVLTYAGSLAYGRDLTAVFQALALDRAPTWRVEYAGVQGAGVQAQAVALGFNGVVDDQGELDLEDALAALDRATVAVVLVGPIYAYGIPAKIFDIISRGKPILLIGPKGCDAARLVERHGLGWVHEPADITGIAATLRRAAAGTVPVSRDIEQLRVDVVMDRLDVHLRALLRAAA